MLHSESSAEEAIRVDMPDYDWCMSNFKTRSAAVRYLHIEFPKATVAEIAALLHMPYRQVFGVIRRMEKELQSVHERLCPVCRRRI